MIPFPAGFMPEDFWIAKSLGVDVNDWIAGELGPSPPSIIAVGDVLRLLAPPVSRIESHQTRVIRWIWILAKSARVLPVNDRAPRKDHDLVFLE